MTHCATHEDDLALLAGGDLASADAERSLREHLRACEGCRELLEALQGDMALIGEFAAVECEPLESLAADVLQRLAATEPSGSRPAQPRRASTQLRAAAAILVVATALTGMFSLQGGSPPADGGGEAASLGEGDITPANLADGLPIRVYRAGDSLELKWAGDGREALTATPAMTYRVVASALPNDFDEGRSVEVAGERLMTSGMPFPTRELGDRNLTFFRVE